MNTEAQQLLYIQAVVGRLLPQLKEAQLQSATPAMVANEIVIFVAISLLVDAAMLSERLQKPHLDKIRTAWKKLSTAKISAELAAAVEAERPSAAILPFPTQPH